MSSAVTSGLAVEVRIHCGCGRVARTLYASASDWAADAPLTSLRAVRDAPMELAGACSEDTRYRVRCPAKRCSVSPNGALSVLRGDSILAAVEAKRRAHNFRTPTIPTSVGPVRVRTVELVLGEDL